MPNHQDGSCAYTETKNGVEIFYKKEATYGKERRQKQLGIRTDEILAIVKELTEMSAGLYKQIFGVSD